MPAYVRRNRGALTVPQASPRRGESVAGSRVLLPEACHLAGQDSFQEQQKEDILDVGLGPRKQPDKDFQVESIVAPLQGYIAYRDLVAGTVKIRGAWPPPALRCSTIEGWHPDGQQGGAPREQLRRHAGSPCLR